MCVASTSIHHKTITNFPLHKSSTVYWVAEKGSSFCSQWGWLHRDQDQLSTGHWGLSCLEWMEPFKAGTKFSSCCDRSQTSWGGIVVLVLAGDLEAGIQFPRCVFGAFQPCNLPHQYGGEFPLSHILIRTCCGQYCNLSHSGCTVISNSGFNLHNS